MQGLVLGDTGGGMEKGWDVLAVVQQRLLTRKDDQSGEALRPGHPVVLGIA